ncbi:MAG: hypothetical protein JWQ55_6950, partial [Rhodopila sp.]|nr:hypothetical protein [Rhodopila sp.]
MNPKIGAVPFGHFRGREAAKVAASA